MAHRDGPLQLFVQHSVQQVGHAIALPWDHCEVRNACRPEPPRGGGGRDHLHRNFHST